jgi:hypothetical protein
VFVWDINDNVPDEEGTSSSEQLERPLILKAEMNILRPLQQQILFKQRDRTAIVVDDFLLIAVEQMDPD